MSFQPFSLMHFCVNTIFHLLDWIFIIFSDAHLNLFLPYLFRWCFFLFFLISKFRIAKQLRMMVFNFWFFASFHNTVTIYRYASFTRRTLPMVWIVYYDIHMLNISRWIVFFVFLSNFYLMLRHSIFRGLFYLVLRMGRTKVIRLYFLINSINFNFNLNS